MCHAYTATPLSARICSEDTYSIMNKSFPGVLHLLNEPEISHLKHIKQNLAQRLLHSNTITMLHLTSRLRNNVSASRAEVRGTNCSQVYWDPPTFICTFQNQLKKRHKQKAEHQKKLFFLKESRKKESKRRNSNKDVLSKSTTKLSSCQTGVVDAEWSRGIYSTGWVGRKSNKIVCQQISKTPKLQLPRRKKTHVTRIITRDQRTDWLQVVFSANGTVVSQCTASGSFLCEMQKTGRSRHVTS